MTSRVLVLKTTWGTVTTVSVDVVIVPVVNVLVNVMHVLGSCGGAVVMAVE